MEQFDRTTRRRISLRLRRAQAIYFSGLVVFTIFAVFAHRYSYFGWDLKVSHFIQRVPKIYLPMRALSVLGDGWVPFALTAITFLLFMLLRYRREALWLLVSVIGGDALDRLIKQIVGRPRPPASLVSILQIEKTESFPSGHVTYFVCYFGFLFFVAYALMHPRTLSRQLTMALCALPVLLIGMSRIYLGAHWPSDTVGAYIFAGLWLGLTIHFYERAATAPARKSVNGPHSET